MDGIVTDAAFTTAALRAVSRASASMMTEEIIGKATGRAASWTRRTSWICWASNWSVRLEVRCCR